MPRYILNNPYKINNPPNDNTNALEIGTVK